MKYIDTEKLKIELDRQKIGYNIDGKHNAEYDTCVKVLRIIDSLQQEQQEVDLEKEYKEYVQDDPVFSKLTNQNVGLAIARHFYELGQLEMRHRITNPEYNAKVIEQLKSEYPAIKEE